MSRRHGKKYADWEFKIDGATHRQEIRVSTEGELRLWTVLPDGGTVSGTDCDELRKTVFARLEAANKLAWSKVIVVVISAPNGSLHFTEAHDAAVKLAWAVRWRATDAAGRIRWKEDETSARSTEHNGLYGDSNSTRKVIPWTQKSEDFMILVSDGIKNLNTRIAQFFIDEGCEARILEMVDASRLLGAG